MTIDSFIRRVAVQDVVYWGNPTPTGDHDFTFDPAIEIKARWEEVDEVIVAADGQERVSRVRAWPLQDVDEEGYMYLGTLDDSGLDSDTDPREVEGAFRIIALRKFPRLGSIGSFERLAYLNMEANRTI